MGFKRFLAAFGVGGPSVDTVLTGYGTRPGALLEGHVELTGGEVEARIDEIAVALAARVELESDEGEQAAGAEFARVPVIGPLTLAPGERRSLPFRYPVPWQAPITDTAHGPLPGAVLGLRTEVVIERAPDKGDLDPVRIHPLAAQERVLDAFARLGFTLKRTDIETGHLAGTRQEFPLFQEIEFHPAPHYAHEIGEVELTFVADPHGMDVVVEFDRRGGMFTPGGDLYGLFRVEHRDADRLDWTEVAASWIDHALDRHRALFGGYSGHGHGGYHPGHDDDHGGGLGGVAGLALGAAGGLAAGYAAAEIVDEVGDLFEGEEEDAEE
ncbi:sporulation protein [Streptomonospora nanhaiensis]|uniref:Sporulation-control protein n=1 Tax=Streptomonospora nanhaiensis TaxID=1323731 RepID=A0A853BKY4_9ACTN|nr:sporulation protein [Streptomonospora nanhaiensis]MBV2365846.1 sporulation protein [Streptomonospora nanhaiensis]MBX9387580.1 sporulation protein [Streptomonospora nanhaiensis]NYI95221.1 sporulation-control protein [Streptomonospora nanhaiensis]